MHVAIIPDGNRRWAKAHNKPAAEGVLEGAKRTVELARFAQDHTTITTLTFWGFSTENWKRPTAEQLVLMKLFENFIDSYKPEALERSVRVVHLGRKDRLSETLRNKLIHLEESTEHFTKFTLCVALDYGGHDELIRAFHKAQQQGQDISEENFSQFLDTAPLTNPNPDLIIRTSGEERLSGFMPWQSAYSEYMFVQDFFPDFSPQALQACLLSFAKRNRRFGT